MDFYMLSINDPKMKLRKYIHLTSKRIKQLEIYLRAELPKRYTQNFKVCMRESKNLISRVFYIHVFKSSLRC